MNGPVIGSIGDRLASARHRRFVGRDAERALFTSLLDAPEPAGQVLHVYGPGGVGKSTLLREFLRTARERGIPSVLVDARNVEPTPQGFLEAMQAGGSGELGVIFIDTYEHLGPLDSWLRDEFLPGIPARTLVVLAGRYPPAAAWRIDPGWQEILRVAPLRNLSPEESQDYLGQRTVPSEQHRRMLEFTHGHPLALSLVADAFVQRPDVEFRPEADPDILKGLLDHFMDHVPGAPHRAALETCGVLRVTNEALLARVLERDDAHELFEWLRQLSFVEAGALGIFPHDLAREALVAELRWRNPEWYAEIHRRARGYYAERVGGEGADAERILADYIFLHRDHPVMRQFFAQLMERPGTGLLTNMMREADVPDLVAMVRTHEGEACAHLAAYWFKEQPENVLVFRGAGRIEGFSSFVALDRTGDLPDPGVAAARRYLEAHAPMRAGETAVIFRHWMSRDSYQGLSPVQSSVLVNFVRHILTTPRLSFSFFCCAEPELWAPIFAYAEMPRMPEADFEVGGHRFGVYGHDWRAVPPMAWLDLLAERELSQPGPTQAPARVPEPVLVLSRAGFASAVRDALRSFTLPGNLASSPLIRSRLVLDRPGESRAAALQALLQEAASELQAAPRTEKFYQALYHTYLHAAPTQERAAELLDLPFSTYRRHLASGLDHVVEALWQRELGASER